jgi:4-amino-4-deoxy-L-arabinose transferase-like glycosyltransferase
MAAAVDLTDNLDVRAKTRSERAWWREWQLALLVLFVLVAYFTRLTELSIRGEESRRGLIAREMIDTGDWIIPRTQGVPLFSRPPLQNWMIASLAILRGDVDAMAIRLPSVCAIFLTSVLVYRYARLFLSSLGALASGLAFASMGQVLELGRVGETDALFTLFVSGALLAWHGGLTRGVSPYRMWCLGYALAALGTLTKGPQAPVYFMGPVALYLLSTRNWRAAFSRAHLAGIGAFVAILATWQIPCILKVGLEGTRQMYVRDVGHRFMDATWFSFGEHMAVYPLELLVCLLPWSALFVVWFNRGFRRTLGLARDHVLFLAICLLVAFPTVWFPPGSRPRYFMSMYPCLAILMGLVVERVARARRTEQWWIVWPLFVRITAVAMLAVGAGFLTISLFDFGLWLAQPAPVAIFYGLVAAGTAFGAWRSVGGSPQRGPYVAVLCIAGFVGFTQVVVMINALKGASVDTAAQIEALKRQLPPGTKLASFNVTHHLFAFHYRDEIPVLNWPETAEEEAARVPYFCADIREFHERHIPFPWTTVAEVSCDRHKLPNPLIRVIVCRRTDILEAGATSAESTAVPAPTAN